MAEYKCGDCFHADLCEESKMLVGFSRDNPAYCGMFLNCADVAPVRHARWEEADWVEPDYHGFGIIKTPKAALRCSNCKNCFKKELLWKDKFCPNCGAKMDGGDGNSDMA